MIFNKRTVLIFWVLFIAIGVSAQTLHFKVTGEFKARTIIAYQEEGGQATVTDKIVLEFDKDIKTGKVGPVTFVNFPSTSSEFRNVEKSCRPSRPCAAACIAAASSGIGTCQTCPSSSTGRGRRLRMR